MEVANRKVTTEMRSLRENNEDLLKKLNELSTQLQKKEEELIVTLTRYISHCFSFTAQVNEILTSYWLTSAMRDEPEFAYVIPILVISQKLMEVASFLSCSCDEEQSQKQLLSKQTKELMFELQEVKEDLENEKALRLFF